VSEERAAELYRQAVGEIGDPSVAGQVRTDMIQAQLNLRAEVGLISNPPPPLAKFVTTEWYERTLALRGVTGK
jgi:hypothetical protein